MHEIEDGRGRERAVLVGVCLPGEDPVLFEESMEELALLSDTAGADEADRMAQNRSRPDAATFVGSGFAERIGRTAAASDADLVIFDDDLSPAQVKNLEQIIPVKIVDRSGLILDIFAERAKTREAKTQVELAQLEYLLPRLTRAWSHLSRQVGGIGTRGPGETQLEVDRRLVRDRITELKKELSRIERQRATRRRAREDFFRATLVGYTNAGKSTLLNALTDAETFTEDRLFATLDATTRALRLPEGPDVLLTDTVGFIRKLPPGLVASFRSTLEEAVVADFLVHVVDADHPHYEDHITSANRVLEELGILEKPTLMVFNKVDRLDEDAARRIDAAYPRSAAVSALTGKGLGELVDRVVEQVRRQQTVLELVIPHSRPDLASSAYEMGAVLDRDDTASGTRLLVRTGRARAGRLRSLVEEAEGASAEEKEAVVD
ncbi:MAG: GTPase HflX [bacterium]